MSSSTRGLLAAQKVLDAIRWQLFLHFQCQKENKSFQSMHCRFKAIRGVPWSYEPYLSIYPDISDEKFSIFLHIILVQILEGMKWTVQVTTKADRQGAFFHHTKFRLPLRPPSTFLRGFPNSWQILSFQQCFLGKIWVIYTLNVPFSWLLGLKWARNGRLL